MKRYSAMWVALFGVLVIGYLTYEFWDLLSYGS